LNNKLKILLGGMIAKIPGQGGLTWVVLQYLLGLQRLGHEVHFLELVTPSDLAPGGVSLSGSDNASYFTGVAKRFGLEGAVSLLDTSTGESVGKSLQELLDYSSECDLLLNLSGILNEERFFARIPVRTYIDLDPAFTQLWNCEQGVDVGMEGHNRFVTIGMNLDTPECVIPTLGTSWIRTLPPLTLANWPIAKEHPTLGLTTVANWRGYGSINYGGVFYGQKAHSLRPLFEAPTLTSASFELALSIHPDEKSDLEQLEKFGWRLLDPSRIAVTPDAFQCFIQKSRAEFGIAKSGYVASNCGWFSDRSICYLASGRPVVAQETGFSAHLPTGKGLFAFESMAELLDRIEQVNNDYEAQCRAAREIAETYFDSDLVLVGLLNNLGFAV
jgi:hypothetical protein